MRDRILISFSRLLFLNKKGQISHLADDADGARTSLEKVRELAAELKVSDNSDIRQAIRDLEAVLGEGDSRSQT